MVNSMRLEIFSAALVIMVLCFSAGMTLVSLPYEVGTDGRGSARPGVFRPYPRAIDILFTSGIGIAFLASLVASLVRWGLPEKWGETFLWLAITGLIFSFGLLMVVLLSQP